MTQQQRHPLAEKKVVYTMPGMDNVSVRRDIEYQADASGSLTMDLYYPPHAKNEARLPVVMFVAGYPDTGVPNPLGGKATEMKFLISWGQLLALSGIVAVVYTNREPVGNARTVLQYIRQNAASLGTDENRIGIMATSGHVPNALSLLMTEGKFLKCAVLNCGFMLDLAGRTGVADAAKMYGFVNPGAGKSVDDVPHEIPLFIARAGKDQVPGLNEAMDRFIAEALAHNMPLTLVNHASAPHAFDIMDDTEASREVVKQMLGFLRFHLLAG